MLRESFKGKADFFALDAIKCQFSPPLFVDEPQHYMSFLNQKVRACSPSLETAVAGDATRVEDSLPSPSPTKEENERIFEGPFCLSRVRKTTERVASNKYRKLSRGQESFSEEDIFDNSVVLDNDCPIPFEQVPGDEHHRFNDRTGVDDFRIALVTWATNGKSFTKWSLWIATHSWWPSKGDIFMALLCMFFLGDPKTWNSCINGWSDVFGDFQ